MDEVQQIPALFNHIQTQLAAWSAANKRKPGYFVLVSSEKLPEETLALMTDKICFTLLPFSIKEVAETRPEISVDEAILLGGYPDFISALQNESTSYSAYIQSFVEHKARPHINAHNVPVFQKFLQLCAVNIGQLLNLDKLGEECGVSFATARQWLQLLEKHYLVFLLQPHGTTFNKRVTKTPKLYFFDTGIACSLLRISTAELLAIHPLRSSLFENLMIADLYKQFCNNGIEPKLFFWRDQNGRYEVDCLIETGESLVALEVKSVSTLTYRCIKKLESWSKIFSKSWPKLSIYAGREKKEEYNNNRGLARGIEFVERII